MFYHSFHWQWQFIPSQQETQDIPYTWRIDLSNTEKYWKGKITVNSAIHPLHASTISLKLWARALNWQENVWKNYIIFQWSNLFFVFFYSQTSGYGLGMFLKSGQNTIRDVTCSHYKSWHGNILDSTISKLKNTFRYLFFEKLATLYNMNYISFF